MIDTITRDRLKEMRLTGMVECLDQLAGPDTTGLTTVDVVKMITDREWERRRNSKLTRLRRAADLAQPHADVTDLRVLPDRSIDTDLVGRLAVGNYIAKHEDVIVLGPTGSGKTYLACALGNKAAQQYKSVLYLRAVDLFDRLTLAERAGSRSQTLTKLVKIDLLILDEWFTNSPTVEQVRPPARADRTPHRRRLHDLPLPGPAREMARPDRGESRGRRHRRPHHRQRPQDDPDLQGLPASGLQTRRIARRATR
jgi:hypothetical protein